MFALISSGSGSQSAKILRWALQGHHGSLVSIPAECTLISYSFPMSVSLTLTNIIEVVKNK